MKQDLSDSTFFYLFAVEKVVAVFGFHEPFAYCCASFFQLCDHGGINTTLGRDVGQTVTRRRPSP